MRLSKRVEKLETKSAPTKLERWHIVGMAEGETEEAAIARHWEPIGPEDSICFLVPFAPAPAPGHAADNTP